MGTSCILEISETWRADAPDMRFSLDHKYEPPHDQTKWHVRPAKTQISLGIRPVWSESLMSAWRNLGSLSTHWADSEDWSDGADAQADLSLC